MAFNSSTKEENNQAFLNVRALEHAGRHAEALEQVNQLIARTPAWLTPLKYKAGILDKLNLRDEAEALLKELIVRDPHAPDWRCALGHLYSESGRFFESQNEFRTALQMFESQNGFDGTMSFRDPEARERYLKNRKAYAYYMLGTMELKPAIIASRLGLTAEAQAKRPHFADEPEVMREAAARAFDLFSAAFGLEPRAVNLFRTGQRELIKSYAWTDRMPEAHQLIPLCASHNPRLEVILLDTLAYAAMKQKRFETAIRLFNRLEILDGPSAGLLNDRGRARAYLKQYEAAELDYLNALQFNPGLSFIHLNLGILYFRMGNAERAIGPMEKALELEPTYRAHHFLAEAYLWLRKDALAQPHIDSARLLSHDWAAFDSKIEEIKSTRDARDARDKLLRDAHDARAMLREDGLNSLGDAGSPAHKRDIREVGSWHRTLGPVNSRARRSPPPRRHEGPAPLRLY